MKNTGKELPLEYRRLCRYLWERINEVDKNDHESLEVLSTITYSLLTIGTETITAPYDDDGFMRELNMWVDLRRDAPDDRKDYGDGIKEAWPELFRE